MKPTQLFKNKITGWVSYSVRYPYTLQALFFQSGFCKNLFCDETRVSKSAKRVHNTIKMNNSNFPSEKRVTKTCLIPLTRMYAQR